MLRSQRCLWSQGIHGTHTCKHNHVHSPVTPFTCFVAYPAHLDRKDICSVSRVHGKQLLMVQRVPHNRVLVIGTRGQQAASREKEQFWPLLKFLGPPSSIPCFPVDKDLGYTEPEEQEMSQNIRLSCKQWLILFYFVLRISHHSLNAIAYQKNRVWKVIQLSIYLGFIV